MKWMFSSLVLEFIEKMMSFLKINVIFNALIIFKLLNVLQGKISYSRKVKDMVKTNFSYQIENSIYCYISEKYDKTQNVEYSFLIDGKLLFLFL